MALPDPEHSTSFPRHTWATAREIVTNMYGIIWLLSGKLRRNELISRFSGARTGENQIAHNAICPAATLSYRHTTPLPLLRSAHYGIVDPAHAWSNPRIMRFCVQISVSIEALMTVASTAIPFILSGG